MLELTNQSGKPVYVNPERIDYFASCEIWSDSAGEPEGTAILFGGGNRLVVRESLLEVVGRFP